MEEKLTDYHCSQESEALTSDLENGYAQSHIVKSIHIVKEFCYQEWPINPFTIALSGMTLERCKEAISLGFATSFTAASLARISALLDMEKDWMESEADYFSKSYAYPKKSSPNSYFWRTSLQLHPEEVYPRLERLPRWGMIVDGVLYPVKDLWRRIKEKDGSFLPTPTASQAGKPVRMPSPSRKSKTHGYDIQDRIGEREPEIIGKKINVHLLEWMLGYPLNWTELEPWAIQWYLLRRKKPLKY